jgi:hypothetical protein
VLLNVVVVVISFPLRTNKNDKKYMPHPHRTLEQVRTGWWFTQSNVLLQDSIRRVVFAIIPKQQREKERKERGYPNNV